MRSERNAYGGILLILWGCDLFADHNVENHIVGVLHTYGTYSSKIPDSLFDIFFDDAVVFGYAYTLAGKDG